MGENIYQKLAKVRKLVEALQKNKDGHNYKYVTEDEILAKIHGGMERYDLSLLPCIKPNTMTVTPYSYLKTKSTRDGAVYDEKVNDIIVKADTEWVWVNNENPDERVIVSWALIGHQQNASMAFGSGLSYSSRYFLLKYFNIATVEDDVDAWKAKQKKAENYEELEAVKLITAEIEKAIKIYAGDDIEKKKRVAGELKKMIRDKSGKPTANFYDIDNVELAAAVKARIEAMVSGDSAGQTKSEPESETGGKEAGNTQLRPD